MKTRIIFGVSGAVAILLGLFVLPPVIFDLAMIVLAAIAATELVGATKLVQDKALLHATTACAVLFGLTQSAAIETMMPKGDAVQSMVEICIVLILFTYLLKKHETVQFTTLAVVLFSAIGIPYLMLSMIRIFHMDNGDLLVLLPMIAAWGSDTCAYFTGMACGKHKLAPVISPKKTIEGAIGGVVGAALVMFGFITLFNMRSTLDISPAVALLLGGVGAVIGQLGDLTFSVIKRQNNVKDYGTIFPGHGGVLDRFDSVVVVAPVMEILLLLFL